MDDTAKHESIAPEEVKTSDEVESSPEEKSRRRRERGQSLVEYAILLTWTCLAMIAVIHGAGQATKGAWAAANNDLVLANAQDH
jgi:Flp pilus assembly pilin Flp